VEHGRGKTPRDRLPGAGDPESRRLHRVSLETWFVRGPDPETLLLREEALMRDLDACHWRWPEGSREARRLGPETPSLLFVQGDPRPRGPSVAVVGTRRPDLYGLVVARTLARVISGAGVRVVSGGALGVDAEAHRGALEGPGGTTVVLAGGLARPHPPSHRPLFREVLWHRAGALVSEAPMSAPAVPSSFPRRNRLIAAMVDAVVVVQAGVPSGALQTAEWARRLGVDVYAVPGDVWYERSDGCHALLRAGARPLTTPGDLARSPGLESLGHLAWPGGGRRPAFLPPAWGEDGPREPPPEVTGDMGVVLEALGDGPRDADALAARTGLSASLLLSALSMLEIQGRARRLPGGLWVRT